MPGSGTTLRRVVPFVVALCLGIGAAVWALRPGPAAPGPPSAAAPTDAPIGWSVAEGGDDPGPGSFGFTLFDSDRNRAIDLTVVVPAGDGPHPLVVFAHGFATCASDYGELLETVVAAGFVVAAPNSPDSSCVANGPERAVAEQAGDLAFVIDVLTDPVAVPEALHGAVAPGRVGVMGHSDGGGAVTTLVLARQDPRVGAAVVLTGALFAPVGPGPFPPLLIVHGTDDEVNAPSESEAVARSAGDDVWLVAVQEGAHFAPFAAPPTADVVGTLVGDFFRATLRSDSAARARLDADSRREPLVPWSAARFPAPSVEPPSGGTPDPSDLPDPTGSTG